MKKYILFFLLVSPVLVNAQVATSLVIRDTRAVVDSANFMKHGMRADFKSRQVIGVPGIGTYSFNLTLSPWRDNSGGQPHQLNFNNGGVFYRTGTYSPANWAEWKTLLMQEQDGSVKIGSTNRTNFSKLAIFGPNLPVGLGSRRDIAFEFDHAGQAIIRAYRGNSWDTHLLFLTTPYAKNEPMVRLSIGNDGNVGIGTEAPQAKLDVRGKVIADEVQIKVNKGADFVFKPNYKLMSLSEVETFVKENQHLPEIPSEKQMLEEGVSVNDMQIKLLQKIEELTLYAIQQQKLLEQQSKEINQLQKEISTLK